MTVPITSTYKYTGKPVLNAKAEKLKRVAFENGRSLKNGIISQ